MTLSRNPLFQRISYILLGKDNGSQAASSLDAMLDAMDSHLDNFEYLVEPAPESKPRTPFDSGLSKEEVSLGNMTPRQRLQVLPQALPLFINMQRAAQGYDGKYTPIKSHASPEFIAELEARAYKAGVRILSISRCRATPSFKGRVFPMSMRLFTPLKWTKSPWTLHPALSLSLK